MTGLPSPIGELKLKVQTMPTDVNLDGNIFGGWIMSQMDIACGIHATYICKGRVVTKAVKELLFEKSVKLGDLACFYTKTISIGKTSVTVYCELWTHGRSDQDSLQKASEATIVMVCVNDQGLPKAINKSIG
ncbi:acyl-CoA thioesterase [Candidatus Liberibacter americanus]|uniref:Acyl-CoA hydrolase n=1 Tax=Candidatus Liberibacter americanus str. Sao Paulo TaxID=1261131 RepID=U6B5R8_9HYPH|nr:acyl-CoA thioesterase [Candidatus Liberibacter americanus]AHA28193.1 Acyl-CoA hydrolase [Candidatus Liberibacter americanus str. Sao Paulo]EMS36292.1 acyl-CoA hydrolase [Candidatus Liberibacter americanus PW_SP]